MVSKVICSSKSNNSGFKPAGLKSRLPIPVFWRLGKTQIGKASIIRVLIATFITGQVFLSNDAFAKDRKIEAYDAKGRRDLERDLVVRDGKVYQQDRQGRILNEKGYINLKDGAEFDNKGRKTGRRFKATGSD